jgi:5-formyltetrahydrofolate cyclo-ligase
VIEHRFTSSRLVPAERKRAAREWVWAELERARAARFPRPVRGRIPNFVGAEAAARALVDRPEFQRAAVVKVNPDAPQRFLRAEVLRQGKLLLAPTPRLRQGFLVLDPSAIPEGAHGRAAAIGGLFAYGVPTELRRAPRPDLLVVGSVAVSPSGARTGKGEGYGEIEYALLRQFGRIGPETPVVTTVHDLQVIEELPLEPFDVSVDLIVTPSRVIEVRQSRPRPAGILWELLSPEKRDEIPLLRELAPAGYRPTAQRKRGR